MNNPEYSRTVLFLGDKKSPLLDWLNHIGESVVQTSEKITPAFINNNNIGFIISYGYTHILKKSILDLLPNRAINLHISYLPWNRGADPNLWSFIKNTPKGVTIHYIDEGIDTGDIIAQKQIHFDSSSETLATSYEKLRLAIQELFKQHWDNIKNKSCPRKKQMGKGSTQKSKDKEPLSNLLKESWNTPVSILEKYTV